MAIVKFGSIVVAARGTIAGTIFSANLAGPYARGWSRGSNPRSVAQSDQRGLLGRLSSQWRDLSQAQRDDWIDYADDAAQVRVNSLGEDYFISGFNWYVKINDQLTAAGAAQRVDAPTLTRPVAPTIEFIRNRSTADTAFNYIRYGVADPGLTEEHVIFASLVFSHGINPIPLRMPFMIVGVPDAGRLLDFTIEFAAEFGNNPVGARSLQSTHVQDAHGQRSPAATGSMDTQSS